MWAFGVTVIECLTRNDPFPDLGPAEAGVAVIKGTLSFFYSRRPFFLSFFYS
jgi:hypothetical protein